MFLLDTSVLIPLRDRDRAVVEALSSLTGEVAASVVSLVELEGGIARDPEQAERRRAALKEMLTGLTVLSFTGREAEAYGMIARTAGYSRRKILDRMIAAHALVTGAVLVTLNPDDFADVPGLKVRAVGSAAAPAS